MIILGSNCSKIASREITIGISNCAANCITVPILSDNNTLYCGIEAVNSRTVLLIKPARKKNSTIKMTKSNVIANHKGTFLLVIILIIGEQIIAIKRESKNGITISADNLIPAKIITIAAVVITIRLMDDAGCMIFLIDYKRSNHYKILQNYFNFSFAPTRIRLFLILFNSISFSGVVLYILAIEYSVSLI